MAGLLDEQAAIRDLLEELDTLQADVDSARLALSEAEAKQAQCEALIEELNTAGQRQAEARLENPRLKAEMDELSARIQSLEVTEGAECPLCGQPLSEGERLRLVEALKIQGKQLGDRFRDNQSLLRDANEHVRRLETQIAEYAGVPEAVRIGDQRLAGLTGRLETLSNREAAWRADGAPRLEQIEGRLREDDYAPEARAKLAQIDAELKEIGYDAAAHDQLREREMEARSSEVELRALKSAQAAMMHLEREIADLETDLKTQEADIARQESEHQGALAALDETQAQMPDLASAERDFLMAQEQENRLRLEVGAAQQKVLVLDELKARREKLEAQRAELAGQVSQYQQLERAFGKDGVPALLIEQALPEIEAQAPTRFWSA